MILPVFPLTVLAQNQNPGQDFTAKIQAALTGDRNAAQALREAGPPGLAALLAAAADQVSALRLNKIRLEAPENTELRAAIDAVAGQRDAYASGLYWFTDLEAAKTEARKTRRPILSLRLLGNLNEEYSCANSRFFRTVLYASAGVSKELRDHYVLHWKSVRPAPLLTIDMGDGRRIKRTITGNSIHYLLDPEGYVLDALPGIYSPQAFLAALGRAAFGTQEAKRGDDPLWRVTGSQSFSAAGNDEIMGAIREWHGREAHNLCTEWLGAAIRAGSYDREFTPSKATLEDIAGKVFGSAFPQSSGYKTASSSLTFTQSLPLEEWQTLRFGKALSPNNSAIVPLIPVESPPGNVNPPAAPHPEVIREFPYPTEFDPPKAMVERPIIQRTVPQSGALPAQDPASPARSGPSLAERMTPALWSRIAEPFQATVALDESSRRFMMQKLPAEIISPSENTSGTADSDQSPFGRQLQRFEAAIGRDMVRNEYYYHNRIHQWLEEDRDGKFSRDVEALNRRIYQELFLTPDYDAWLGLVPEDTYTALEKDGCACDKGAPSMRQTAKP
ncbi:MAG: hypothetical protein V4726_20260 [Verrucomicrobiota bacterium]